MKPGYQLPEPFLCIQPVLTSFMPYLHCDNYTNKKTTCLRSEDMLMTDFTITPKAQNVFLESWLDLPETEQQEMDHVEYDEQVSTRFFHFEGCVYDIADFMRDDRFPGWHASYPLNAFAMLMIRVDDSGDTIDIGLLH